MCVIYHISEVLDMYAITHLLCWSLISMAICDLSFNVLNQYSVHSYNHIGTYSEIFSKNKKEEQSFYNICQVRHPPKM